MVGRRGVVRARRREGRGRGIRRHRGDDGGDGESSAAGTLSPHEHHRRRGGGARHRARRGSGQCGHARRTLGGRTERCGRVRRGDRDGRGIHPRSHAHADAHAVVTTRDEAVTEAVPFERTSVDDSTMAQGQSAVTTAGQNGERTRTYRVTLTDGKETKRELVSDAVTVPPVTEVTSVGTYVEPAAPPPAAAPGGCDPNYADACVPIASDVDCAGGKGNGPAYFDGVARVVDRDIYKLDGDGDGWACNG